MDEKFGWKEEKNMEFVKKYRKGFVNQSISYWELVDTCIKLYYTSADGGGGGGEDDDDDDDDDNSHKKTNRSLTLQ